ncbi:SBBP repeat-containing protein [Xanthocytophaga flava]|uniref:SBBP repeat-containing protein n=1 Tax=Xanthocytophaga flava TaxID=3048013 RepID=UPI0028D6E97D|nr:SBBP repeat-containing protein [Xanthocytophaga flavus]MDJ1473081.1 SBBP repeat-containing protein [Xanthocytophaga flavus]
MCKNNLLCSLLIAGAMAMTFSSCKKEDTPPTPTIDPEISATAYAVKATGYITPKKQLVDKDGNLYVTGSFSGTAVFGTTTLTAQGQSDDIFLAKYNTKGELQWVKQEGGADTDVGRSLALDASGNVFVIGEFSYTALIGGTSLTSKGYIDIFLAKYTSEGTVQWVKQAGSTNLDYGTDVVIDGTDNIYITGNFYAETIIGNTTLTAVGNGRNTYIAKYTSSGEMQWAKSGGGYGRYITLDGSGTPYIAGEFYDDISFGSKQLTVQGNSDVFIVHYSATGEVLDARTIGSTNAEFSIRDLKFDTSGNLYSTGLFTGTGTVGTTTLTSKGQTDVFTLKYNNTGAVQWVKAAASNDDDYVNALGIDGSGNVYITGYFYNPFTLESTTLTPAGGSDLFVAKYNNAGELQWAQKAGGESTDMGTTLTLDRSNNLYVAGSFYKSIQLHETTLTAEKEGLFLWKVKH